MQYLFEEVKRMEQKLAIRDQDSQTQYSEGWCSGYEDAIIEIRKCITDEHRAVTKRLIEKGRKLREKLKAKGMLK